MVKQIRGRCTKPQRVAFFIAETAVDRQRNGLSARSHHRPYLRIPEPADVVRRDGKGDRIDPPPAVLAAGNPGNARYRIGAGSSRRIVVGVGEIGAGRIGPGCQDAQERPGLESQHACHFPPGDRQAERAVCVMARCLIQECADDPLAPRVGNIAIVEIGIVGVGAVAAAAAGKAGRIIAANVRQIAGEVITGAELQAPGHTLVQRRGHGLIVADAAVQVIVNRGKQRVGAGRARRCVSDGVGFHLIEIVVVHQFAAMAAVIRETKSGLETEIPFQCDVPLLDSRVFEVKVVRILEGLGARLSQIIRKRVGKSQSWPAIGDAVGEDGDVARLNTPCAGDKRAEGSFDIAPIAAAYHRPAIAGEPPGESNAGREVGFLRIAQALGKPLLAGRKDRRRRDGLSKQRVYDVETFVRNHYSAVHIDSVDGLAKVGQQISGVVEVVAKHRMVFPAQTVIHCKARRDLPVVLRVERVAAGIALRVRLQRAGERGGIRNAQQKRRVRVADGRSYRVVERVDAQKIETESVGEQGGHIPVIPAKLEGVTPAYPGEIVKNLNRLRIGLEGIRPAGSLKAGDPHVGIGIHTIQVLLDIGQQAHLRGYVGGRNTGNGCHMDAVPAGPDFVYHVRVEDEIVRSGKAPVIFRPIISTGEDRSSGSVLHRAPLVGKAREGSLARGNILVEPEIALIAGDGRGEVRNVVVGYGARSPGVGQRKQVLQDVLRQRRNERVGNLIIRERRAAQISDHSRRVSREIPRAQGQRRDTLRQHAFTGQAQSLVSHMEKGLVLALVQAGHGQGTSQVSAEIVHDGLRNNGAERVPGSKGSILVVLKNAAAELIAATPGDRGDVADAAKLGGVVDFAYANFGNPVKRREQLGDGRSAACAHSGDAVDSHGKHAGLAAGHRQVAAVVDRYARLCGQGCNGAGGSQGTRRQRHWEIRQFLP